MFQSIPQRKQRRQTSDCHLEKNSSVVCEFFEIYYIYHTELQKLCWISQLLHTVKTALWRVSSWSLHTVIISLELFQFTVFFNLHHTFKYRSDLCNILFWCFFMFPSETSRELFTCLCCEHHTISHVTTTVTKTIIMILVINQLNAQNRVL